MMAPKDTRNLLKTAYAAPETVVNNKPGNVSFSPNEIKINKNNVIGVISDGIPGSYYDVMANFFRNHRIYKALTLNPQRLYHHYLCEFWYSAQVTDSDKISFSLKDGKKSYVIDLDMFRKVLCLDIPENEQFEHLSDDAPAKEMLPCIGYTGDVKTTVSNSHMSPSWKFFFAMIIESLGGASGGHDQANSTQMKIAYALWKGINVDFARIIYTDLVSKLKAKKRKTFVSYIRFLSLVFKELLRDEYDDEFQDYSPPEATKDFSMLSEWVSEPKMSEEMLSIVPEKKRYKLTQSVSPFINVASIVDHSCGASVCPQKNDEASEYSTGNNDVAISQGSTRPLIVTPISIVGPERFDEALAKVPSITNEKPNLFERVEHLTTPVVNFGSSPETSKMDLENEITEAHTTAEYSIAGRFDKEKQLVSSQPLTELDHGHEIAVEDSDQPIAATVSGDLNSNKVDLNIQDESQVEDRQLTTFVPQSSGTTQVVDDHSFRFASPWKHPQQIILTDSDSDADVEEEITFDDLVKNKHPSFLGFTPDPVSIPTIDTISHAQTSTIVSEMAPPPPPHDSLYNSTTGFSPLNLEDTRDILEGSDTVPHCQEKSTFGSSVEIPTVPFLSETSMLVHPSSEIPSASLESRIESNISEIKSLSTLVNDLKNSFEASKFAHTTDLLGVTNELRTFAYNEVQVYKKLNEMTTTINKLNNKITASSIVVQHHVAMSVTTNLKTFQDMMKKEVHEIVNTFQDSLSKDELVRAISDEVNKYVETDVLKKVLEEIRTLNSTSLLGSEVSDVKSVGNQLKTVVDNMKADLESHSARLSDFEKQMAISTARVPSFSDSDRELLTSISKYQEGQTSELSKLNAASVVDPSVSQLKTEIQELKKAVESLNNKPIWEPSFSENDRDLLSSMSLYQQNQATQLSKLKSAFCLFGKHMQKSVETQDWSYMKGVVHYLESLDLSESTRGEVLKGVHPLASIEEVKAASKAVAGRKDGGHPKKDSDKAITHAAGPGILIDKDKRKEVETEIPSPRSVSDELHSKIKEDMERINENKKILKHEALQTIEQFRTAGILDSHYSFTLGISVEVYQKVKNDPRIVKALAIFQRVAEMGWTTDEELNLDSLSTGTPFEQLKERHQESKKKLLSEAHSLVQAATVPPKIIRNQHATQSKPRTKKDVESDLRTFVDQTSTKQFHHEVFPEYQMPKKYVPNDLHQARIDYDEIMKHRTGDARIVEVFIQVHQGRNTFFVKLKRSDGSQTEIDKAQVFDFGYFEWIEMAELLVSRRQNKYEKEWLRHIKERIEMKIDLEAALGIKSDPIPDCILAISNKRKSFGSPSLERPFKK